jgi:hypothetical protein
VSSAAISIQVIGNTGELRNFSEERYMAIEMMIAEEYRHGAPPKAPAMRDMPMRD